ncbi:hypothetical protein ENUP19_0316G0013 [Entamoeba nuttalli]|uniref:TLDc domain-containing protein n=1 Tax=Entamoeba nuttalli TaxID=412467 RepID=A0ABQ0DVV8_9EUKA
MKINKDERNRLFNELQETCNNANSQIEEVMKSAREYNESWLNNIAEEISDVEGESPEDRIKRIEGIYDRKEEIVRGNEKIGNKLKEGMMMIYNLNIVYQRINKIIYEDKEILSEYVDTIITKVMETEEIRVNKLIEGNKRCINRYKKELEDIREDWESKRVEKKYPPKHQIQQLEEWTIRKFGNIIFDSDIDDWKVDTSVFNQRIMNKEHIIIIIEDEEGNKFGGYINSKIDKVNEWINDSNAFVFSLESNGRLEGMMKFDIMKQQYAFYLFNQSSVGLFEFGNGGDILAYKENNKTTSSSKQYSFEYKGIEDTLCGKQHPDRFTPKRFIVIEMK